MVASTLTQQQGRGWFPSWINKMPSFCLCGLVWIIFFPLLISIGGHEWDSLSWHTHGLASYLEGFSLAAV